VTWVLLVRQDNIAQYTATGVGTIASDDGQCKYPATSGQLGGSGILVVDFNTSPPTYKGIGATGVSMHVMTAMQLLNQAPEGMQIKDAKLAGIFNMGGAAVANYVSLLEPAR